MMGGAGGRHDGSGWFRRRINQVWLELWSQRAAESQRDAEEADEALRERQDVLGTSQVGSHYASHFIFQLHPLLS